MALLSPQAGSLRNNHNITFARDRVKARDSPKDTKDTKWRCLGALLVEHPILDLRSGVRLSGVSSSPVLGSILGMESTLKRPKRKKEKKMSKMPDMRKEGLF